MALLRFFGFDEPVAEDWIGSAPASTVQGRRPSSRAWDSHSSRNYNYQENTDDTIIIGFAADLTTNSSYVRLRLSSNVNGSFISFRAGYPVTLNGAMEGTRLAPEGWVFIETRIRLNLDENQTYSVEVRIDGEEYLNYEGTHNNSNSTFSIYHAKTSFNFQGTERPIDDLYICNGEGDTYNTFLGDVQIDTLRPNGEGKSTDWLGSDGDQVDNWELVNENPVSILDYVEATTPGDTDFYTLDNLEPGRTPLAIKTHAYAAKNDAGERVYQVGMSDGVNDVWSEDSYLNVTPNLTTSEIYHTAPDGGEWTPQKINDLQIGVRVVDPTPQA